MSTQTTAHLIELLGQLTNGVEHPADYGYLTDGAHEELPSIIQEIVGEACDVLIRPDGRPDYAAHQQLAVYGYRVIPGEVDSFGWLSGIIVTSQGKIVYG